jgi:DNA-binding protein HU-beta
MHSGYDFSCNNFPRHYNEQYQLGTLYQSTASNIREESFMATKAKPMTKAQLVTELAETLETKKSDVNGFLDTLTSIAYRETKKKGAFTLPGVGKLVLVKRKARKGRNPATGEEIQIKAKTVVKFRVAKACKDTIIPPK